jgi:hypothetical protein
MTLVAFVDKQHGKEGRYGTLAKYLSLPNVSDWLHSYLTPREKVGKHKAPKVPCWSVSTHLRAKQFFEQSVEAYTAAYVLTLTRCVRALAQVWVLPMLGGSATEASRQYLADVSKITAKVVSELQRVAKEPRGRVRVVSKSQVEHLEPLQLTLGVLKARLLVFETKMHAKQLELQSLGQSKAEAVGVLRLQVAQMKAAYLASLLLIWTCNRRSDIKNLVINRDIRLVTNADGKRRVVVDAAETKTRAKQA